MGANRWIGWRRAICLYAGLVLLTSCQPFYWMEDAHTLGKGRWKVDGQAYIQYWDPAYKDNRIPGWAFLDFGCSYGVTDRLDLGWMATSATITGLRWKYRLFQTPAKHALAVGGRCMTHVAFLSLGLSYFEIYWQTDLRYTRSYRWGTLSFNPSVMYYRYAKTKEDLFPFHAFLGLHANLPLIGDQLTLQIGGSGGYPIISPFRRAKKYFFFTGGVGMAYSFGRKR